ncbi:MAG: heme ABC exporter ATP-binding protein CcmA [Pseudomonadota bacterium]
MLIGMMERDDLRLVVEDAAVSRGGHSILSDVSFSLAVGQGLLVTGPNGSGKSTLLRAVAGFLPLDDGRITTEPNGEPVAAHAHFLNVMNAMKTALTVQENLRFHQKFGGAPVLSVEDALDRVNLSHVLDNRFGDLSTGQRRRVALARLLLNHRPIWLIDEPTSGLDTASDMRFAEIIADYMAGGGIVIAATHLPIDVPGMRHLRFEEEVA